MKLDATNESGLFFQVDGIRAARCALMTTRVDLNKYIGERIISFRTIWSEAELDQALAINILGHTIIFN